MIFITLGLLGIWLRFSAQINLFGKLSLFAALIGAMLASIAWLLMIAVANTDIWNLFFAAFLLYLAGHSVFGGFATTTHLLPRWNAALLIGSALPLTVLVLGFPQSVSAYQVNWSGFAVLLLIGVGWILTGVALNSKTDAATRSLASA